MAGVNLDGIMFRPVLNVGVGRPFLLWGSEGHNFTSEPSWEQFWEAMETLHPGEWMKELSLKDSVHGTFGDFSLIADVGGLRDNEELVEVFFGKITGIKVMETLKVYLDDYFQMTLKGKGEGLLAGPNEEFPEVVFVRN